MSWPSDSRGKATIRTTDAAARLVWDSLPTTRRDSSACRHILARGSRAIARVQDSSPLRQRNSIGKTSETSLRSCRRAPIAANDAPSRSPVAGASVQDSTRLQRSVSIEVFDDCFVKKYRTTPRSCFRSSAILCSSSSPSARASSAATDSTSSLEMAGCLTKLPTRMTPCNCSFLAIGTHNA